MSNVQTSQLIQFLIIYQSKMFPRKDVFLLTVYFIGFRTRSLFVNTARENFLCQHKSAFSQRDAYYLLVKP